MQPKMKKRKSVTTLNEKDTRDANKYVLTHQDLDSDGGLATKLVKVCSSTFTQISQFLLQA